MASPRSSKRREEHNKAKRLKNLHFLIKWVDEPDAIDVVPAKKIATGEGDADDLEEGSNALFLFDGDGKAYEAQVLAKGLYKDLKLLQKIKEKELDLEDDQSLVRDGTKGKENENTDKVIVKTKKKPNKSPAKSEKTPRVSPKKKTAIKKVVKARRKLNLAAEDAEGSPPKKQKSTKSSSKDKAKDCEASRMTALLMEEDNWDHSDPEHGDYGDLEDDDPRFDLTGTNTEFPSATSSASPTGSSSGSGANSTPRITPKVSWTPQTLPSPFETPKLGSSNWGALWGSRSGRGFGESGYKCGYGFEGYGAGDNYGAGAGADQYCPRSSFGTGASYGNYGPYSAEPYYGLDGRLGGIGSANGMANRIKRELSSESLGESSASASGRTTPVYSSSGAVLGDPKGQHMVISGFSQRDVRAAEAVSCDADKLALNLLDIFFTKDVLSTSLVTKWDGREMLDQDTIEGIRLHVSYLYPDPNDKARWKAIIKKINNKCRNTKNRNKSTRGGSL